VSEIVLETADDPRVADYRDLRDAELIRTRGQFVAEGRLVVQRLIEDGRYSIRSLLLSTTTYEALRPWLSRLDPSVPIYVCPVTSFLEIIGFDLHRGCLALVERPPLASVADVLVQAQLVVVLEDVANADNVGGVFRSAAAFGAGAVLLSPGCCDPLYRKAVRTSMAATLTVPFSRLADWPAGLGAIRARGFAMVALTPGEPAMPLDDFVRGNRPDRIALLLGSEAVGLTAEVEAMADCRVRIPIRREVDSLNLSVAAGIAMYVVSAFRRADAGL
jgi:tRNA G18 (ribose-2'-O)-methylase SpoU